MKKILTILGILAVTITAFSSNEDSIQITTSIHITDTGLQITDNAGVSLATLNIAHESVLTGQTSKEINVPIKIKSTADSFLAGSTFLLSLNGVSTLSKIGSPEQTIKHDLSISDVAQSVTLLPGDADKEFVLNDDREINEGITLNVKSQISETGGQTGNFTGSNVLSVKISKLNTGIVVN